MASSHIDYFSSRHGHNIHAHAAVPDTDDFSDDESSLDEYFDNYVPLSSLPTPPLSTTSPIPLEDNISGEGDPQLIGPARYLANLVPTQSIRVRPSPNTVAIMLSRSYLPLETLALAACVLDALSSQFGRSWRNSLSGLNTSPLSSPSKSFASFTSPPTSASGIPPLPPSETIILAALKVSASFLDDSRTADPSVWAAQIGGMAGITGSALEKTVRLLLADIGYEMCSFTPEEVERRRKAMMRGVELVANAAKAAKSL